MKNSLKIDDFMLLQSLKILHCYPSNMHPGLFYVLSLHDTRTQDDNTVVVPSSHLSIPTPFYS